MGVLHRAFVSIVGEIPAFAGMTVWGVPHFAFVSIVGEIPAFAGMTVCGVSLVETQPSLVK